MAEPARIEEQTNGCERPIPEGGISPGMVVRAFLDGLLKPSLPALVGCLAVSAACFLGCVFLLTPEFLGRHALGYLAANSEDSYGYLSSQVLSLRTAEELPESVTLLGASAMRESLDVALLSREIQAVTGEEVEVLPLLCEGLTDWEMAAIACELGSRLRGLVIIEVSPGHFSRPLDWVDGLTTHPRIVFYDNCLDEQLRMSGADIPRRYGNLFLDHYRFFFNRPGMVLNLFFGPPEIEYNRAQSWRKIEGDALKEALQQRMETLKPFDELHGLHVEIFGRILGYLRSDQLSIVLLETPRNPLLVEVDAADQMLARIQPAYLTELDRLADTHDAAYWDLNEEAAFTAEEFVDSAHLQDWEAVERYTRILAGRVSALWATKHGGDRQ